MKIDKKAAKCLLTSILTIIMLCPYNIVEAKSYKSSSKSSSSSKSYKSSNKSYKSSNSSKSSGKYSTSKKNNSSSSKIPTTTSKNNTSSNKTTTTNKNNISSNKTITTNSDTSVNKNTNNSATNSNTNANKNTSNSITNSNTTNKTTTVDSNKSSSTKTTNKISSLKVDSGDFTNKSTYENTTNKNTSSSKSSSSKTSYTVKPREKKSNYNYNPNYYTKFKSNKYYSRDLSFFKYYMIASLLTNNNKDKISERDIVYALEENGYTDSEIDSIMMDLENEQINYEHQANKEEASKQEINNETNENADPVEDVVSTGLGLATTGLIGLGLFKMIRKRR